MNSREGVTTIVTDNVNGALQAGKLLFTQNEEGVHPLDIDVRGSRILEWPKPVVTVYRTPMRCVLDCPTRDINPFLHLLESLWILAGRKDVKFLRQIVSSMKEYSDDGYEFWGAYGDRLRHPVDQLHLVTKLIKEDPFTRRATAVIYRHQDTGYSSKDIPCNTVLHFLQREGRIHLTVSNRSNDMVWGAYGTNAVQFSFILQYVAYQTGYDVGTLTQFSNSFHVYPEQDAWKRIKGAPPSEFRDPYSAAKWDCWPVFAKDSGGSLKTISRFCDWAERILDPTFIPDRFERFASPFPDQRFLDQVAAPLVIGLALHKIGKRHPDETIRALWEKCWVTSFNQRVDWVAKMMDWLQKRKTGAQNG